MVRLTADLIWKSPHFFNAIRERELDLRGNKIAVIENIGATEDQFDTIDLSDNEIVKLENFPNLNRLGTLLLNNNRITRINPNLGEYLPKLHTLVLTNNRLTNLVEIDPLTSLPKLQFLSLLDNNITKKPNYRLYVIHKLKFLRVLDFRKVKQKHSRSHTKEEQTPKPVAPTPEQILAIKAAIVNSQTLEEVARLEQALKSGQLPADLNINDIDSAPKSESAPENESAPKNGSSEQDNMITDEKEANDETKDDESEQKKDESAEMEEAVVFLILSYCPGGF
ncbi:UNVERIFIED_CONTAM: U2 small nuclear ribonucleoprotein A' [Sesamum angustifolium]|uniref:U2 small nuclear ribonucleoprotein A n=1 Tax=Sesamum angustifolium TaxID=2727405 RepID=A0AAW2LK07_9LAMI